MNIKSAVRPVSILILAWLLALDIKAAGYAYRGPLPADFPQNDGVCNLAFAVKLPRTSNYIGRTVFKTQHEVTNRYVAVTNLDFSARLERGGLYYLYLGWRASETNRVDWGVTDRLVVVDEYDRLLDITRTPWMAWERLKQSTFVDVLLYLVGMGCIVVYALEKFNTPTSNRSTTTRLRYNTAVVAYAAFGLIVYLLLISTPELLAVVMKSEPKALPRERLDWSPRMNSGCRDVASP